MSELGPLSAQLRYGGPIFNKHDGFRASLIVTDEAPSSETGKGTDFVVLLSGGPQEGIKFRRCSPGTEFGYARSRDRVPYWRSPFMGSFWTW